MTKAGPAQNQRVIARTGRVRRSASLPRQHSSTDCIGNGSVDLSPSSVPSREVRERSTAGTSQASKRSAETSAAPSLSGGTVPASVQVRDIHTPDFSRFSRLRVDLVGHAWARSSTHHRSSGSLAGSSPRTAGQRNPGASGSVNRLLRPESVRHMSVTTATQRLTAAHHETRRDNNKKARETGKTQLTGYLCRWWQVLGSNQRRLSRRFYIRPPRLK